MGVSVLSSEVRKVSAVAQTDQLEEPGKMRHRLGNGKIQKRIRRAFIFHGGPITSPQALEWAYPRLSNYLHKHRWSARRALLRLAEPIGRQSGQGRPMLWQCKAENP